MSNSLHPQTRSQAHDSSPDMFREKVSGESQQSIPFDSNDGLPGSYDDTQMVRGVLLRSIKNSGLSRTAIADRMTYLLARTVTDKMLDAFTAESRSDRRWPAEFDRAFCEATGDMTLLRCRAEKAGLHVISASERKLLELGRQMLIQERAAATIAQLRTELAEVALG